MTPGHRPRRGHRAHPSREEARNVGRSSVLPDPGPGPDSSQERQPGTDTVDYTGAARRVTVDLQAGFSQGTGNDLLLSIENVTGSAFGDDLRGDDLPNVFAGGEGDDVMDMRGGNDVADGGPGTDIADGGPGTDTCTVEFAYNCE